MMQLAMFMAGNVNWWSTRTPVPFQLASQLQLELTTIEITTIG
jgi:hypothetical protein